MTIWILALLLLASVAAMGYRQGAVRVAFSLGGILMGSILALPLARLIKPLVSICGVQSPVLLWLLPPCVVFLLVLTVFKAGGFMVHQKVEVFQKYHNGELRLALWERLSRRLGLCLGLLNGSSYLVLLSLLVYLLSYWTYQISAGEAESKGVRLLNRLGADLQASGLNRVARAVDRTPGAVYDAADAIGLIYHNDLLEARLARYPAFLGLGERAEFKDIAGDAQFAELRQKQVPLFELLDHPKMQAILNNPDVFKLVCDTVAANLADLTNYLQTGKSAKYDAEPVLGRWDFDVSGAILLLRKNNPKISSQEMQRYRNWVGQSFAKATLLATTENQVFLKDFPNLKGGSGASGWRNLHGEWKNTDGNYTFSYNDEGKSQEVSATVQGDRLSVITPLLTLVFQRED
jgi:hypothetical protein